MSPTQLMTGEHSHDSNDMSSQVYPIEVGNILSYYMDLQIDYRIRLGMESIGMDPFQHCQVILLFL